MRRAITAEQVEAALARLPTHGWTAGFFGRRARALLALAETGLTYQRLATLATSDLTHDPAAGTFTIAAEGADEDGSQVVVVPHEGPLRCRACALVRWLRVLERAARPGGERPLARALAAAPELTSGSPHACRWTRPLVHRTDLPVLPPITQRGWLAVTPVSLTARSIAHLAVTTVTGPPVQHRDLSPAPAPLDEAPPAAQHREVEAPPALYTVADRDAALARRRADHQRLEELDAVLDRIAEHADQLAARTSDLLGDATTTVEDAMRSATVSALGVSWD